MRKIFETFDALCFRQNEADLRNQFEIRNAAIFVLMNVFSFYEQVTRRRVAPFKADK